MAKAVAFQEEMMFQQSLETLRKKSNRSKYENFIGGKWVAPKGGQYFDNISPINGEVLCQVARSQAEDIDLALDAAHAAKEKWGRTSVTERSNLLLKIADRMEANLETLAIAETLIMASRSARPAPPTF